MFFLTATHTTDLRNLKLNSKDTHSILCGTPASFFTNTKIRLCSLLMNHLKHFSILSVQLECSDLHATSKLPFYTHKQ